MNRKQFLKYVSWSTALSVTMPSLVYCSSNANTNAKGNEPDPDFIPDLDIELTSVPDSMGIMPGRLTDIYRYEARIIHGESDKVVQLPDSYPGPVIRIRKGEKVRVRYKNALSQESIIHWHGLHIAPEMDGHPMYAVQKGEQYIYEFEVNNPPGTYWFHPHPDKITGPQVYYGLAGLFIVEDAAEMLPRRENDIPVIIQDRMFDDDNQLVYIRNNQMSQIQGFLGDEILINGKTSGSAKVNRTAYRLRLLNGSNSRIYKLAWSDNSGITVIGTDGGLLERPVNKPYLMLAPGERVEVWKDFSSYDAGSELVLKSLAFNDGSNMGMGRMGGMMGNRGMQSGSVPNGQTMELMQFTVNNTKSEPGSLPGTLTNLNRIDPDEASNAGSPRKFHFFNDHMQWVINGETFQMHEVADWEKVQAGTTEIWEFINGNDGSGMGMMQNMMQMPHPVHIHGFSFRIIERDISGMDAGVWSTVKDGFVDEGLQDTFLLMPGMKVKILISFEDFTGKYIYHCHNLEHEDMGMMRNFEIID